MYNTKCSEFYSKHFHEVWKCVGIHLPYFQYYHNKRYMLDISGNHPALLP
jgi:hypothetical protein